MSICFLSKRDQIRSLLQEIEDFKKYCGMLDLDEIDQRATFHTKCFLLYTILGIISYVSVPLLTVEVCEDRRSENMKRNGIPCGLVARFRLPFAFDYTPLFQIALAHQIYLVTSITIVIVTITMLLCGLLLFATEQLKYLRSLMLGTCSHHEKTIRDKFRFCIRYHTVIIKYVPR